MDTAQWVSPVSLMPLSLLLFVGGSTHIASRCVRPPFLTPFFRYMTKVSTSAWPLHSHVQIRHWLGVTWLTDTDSHICGFSSWETVLYSTVSEGQLGDCMDGEGGRIRSGQQTLMGHMWKTAGLAGCRCWYITFFVIVIVIVSASLLTSHNNFSMVFLFQFRDHLQH
jgi:hypothetical protein